jgi:RNA polymerase sigma factor (TIGR02999 family)
MARSPIASASASGGRSRDDTRPAVTALLAAHAGGDTGALDRLMPLIYADLRRIARTQLRRRQSLSLDTAGLVHDAYLRLVDQSRVEWRDRGHFFAVCALAMRQIVVDRARRRQRLKRGGDQIVVSITEANEPRAAGAAIDVLTVDLARDRLALVDARLARVVECRYFAGLTDEETAVALGVSVRTAQREWFKARAWLRNELGAPGRG